MRGETFVRFGPMIDQLFNSYWSAETRFATLGAVPPAPGSIAPTNQTSTRQQEACTEASLPLFLGCFVAVVQSATGEQGEAARTHELLCQRTQ